MGVTKYLLIAFALLLLSLLVGCSDDNETSSSGSSTGSIAFASTINDVQGIYQIDDNGNNFRLIAADGTDPAMQPFGDLIAFVRGGNLFVVHRDGSGLTQLTDNGVGVFVEDPAFNIDGQTIAYATGPVTENPVRSINLISVNGGTPTTIITNGAQPSISPNNDFIAFVRDNDIYTADLNGDNITNVTNSAIGGTLSDPAICSRGLNISFNFTAVTEGAIPEIQRVAADGTNRITLISDASMPFYRPSGGRIAFIRNGAIYTAVSTDGSDIQQLTEEGLVDSESQITWGNL